jgi:hypothetical protein
MLTVVPSMHRLRSIIASRSRFDVATTWNSVIKRTIARFVRGNIAAQNQRVLLPNEQKKKHEKAKKIAEKWRIRKSQAEKSPKKS